MRPEREVVEKRTRTSKTFDLGDGRYRCEIGQWPMHFQRDGQWHDIDFDSHEIDERGNYVLRNCPYALKISGTVPGYEYTSLSGRRVSVDLLTNASEPLVEGGLYKWPDVGRDTDYVIQPLPTGCATLLILHSPESSRFWRWRVVGDLHLIRPLIGTDAAGRVLELIEHRDLRAGVIEVQWTGRTLAPGQIRRKRMAAWSDEVTYPVKIDPTVNENIAAGADDVHSVWVGSGATFALFSAASAVPIAGREGTYRAYAGVRFQTVAIPTSVTIDSATLTVRVTGVNGTPNLNIFGNDVDDAPAWADPGNRVKNITKTTASTNKADWVNGADNTATITSVVAEIVARAGWASNNDMAFGLFNNAGAGTHNINFAALEHATLTEARLSITYTAAGGGAVLDHYANKEFHSSRFVKPRFLIKS